VRARVLAPLLAAALLSLSATAVAVPKDRSWATINRCDTAGKSNAIGIRAGMAGNGTRQRMYMRFVLQWYDPQKGRYVSLSPPSTWVDAGSARFRLAQRGFDFLGLDDPPPGKRFKFRGLVRFEWRALRRVEGRRREVVVKRAKRITRGGLRGVKGGDPPGRSDAVCVVESPSTP
jgi:hypothetical protein